MVNDTHTRRRRMKVGLKLLLVTFYFSGGLDAVSTGKPSDWMSNFWMARFLKTEYVLNFGFPHIPTCHGYAEAHYASLRRSCTCTADLCT